MVQGADQGPASRSSVPRGDMSDIGYQEAHWTVSICWIFSMNMEERDNLVNLGGLYLAI